MTRTNNGKKRKLDKKTNPNKIDKKIKNKNIKKTKLSKKQNSPIPSDSDSTDSDTSNPENIQILLESYTKDQLIDFIVDAATNDDNLFNRIREAADQDVSHRKIFVHGLGWDTTSETLVSVFEPFGEIEECTVVTDRVTGKAKGFGFVLFKSRKSAVKSLKEPRKKVKSRVISCQLASIGSASVQQNQESAGRKIYVGNVDKDTDPARLRMFFEQFGEIETGPIGFDMQTGKARGFALFVYKTLEGARKSVEEPHKIFEGNQLECRLAASQGKHKSVTKTLTTSAQPGMPVQVPQGLGSAQHLAMLSNYPGYNPMFLPIGAAAGFGQPLFGSGQLGQNFGAGAGAYSGPALHGVSSLAGNRPLPPSLLQAYPPSSKTSTSGSYSGYPSFLWDNPVSVDILKDSSVSSRGPRYIKHV